MPLANVLALIGWREQPNSQSGQSSEDISCTIVVSERERDDYDVYVRGVHGNKVTTGGVKSNLSSLKHESRCAAVLSCLNGVNLLSYHRKYFYINTIKLIKTAP